MDMEEKIYSVSIQRHSKTLMVRIIIFVMFCMVAINIVAEEGETIINHVAFQVSSVGIEIDEATTIAGPLEIRVDSQDTVDAIPTREMLIDVLSEVFVNVADTKKENYRVEIAKDTYGTARDYGLLSGYAGDGLFINYTNTADIQQYRVFVFGVSGKICIVQCLNRQLEEDDDWAVFWGSLRYSREGE